MARSHGKGGVDNYITGRLRSIIDSNPSMTFEQAATKLLFDIPEDEFKQRSFTPVPVVRSQRRLPTSGRFSSKEHHLRMQR